MRSRRETLVVLSAEDLLQALRTSGLLPPHALAGLATVGTPRDPRPGPRNWWSAAC